MKKQKEYFRLTLVISNLLICMLILFACAPIKIKIYQMETQPEKTIPEKTSSERIFQEKTVPEKTTPVKTVLVKPPLEKPPTEKIPTVKPSPEKTHKETVSEWKSYQDLVKWMENDFSFDRSLSENSLEFYRLCTLFFEN